MRQKIYNNVDKIFNFLFPQKCIGCGEKDAILCKRCLDSFPYPEIDNNEYKYIFAATNYNYEPARKAIWLLKYRKIKQLAEPLADLIYKRLYVKIAHLKPFVIIPIPLSKKRLRERGFNQAELIAKYLRTVLGDTQRTVLCLNVLYKKIHTESQVAIKNRKKRLQNLKDSFSIKNQGLIKNKNIILIDDVVTTGATISEARDLIMKAGPKKVVALVVAKG